ncbi:MAG: NAD(P)H-hydrate dehydratase [Acetobacteraceae bacterium]
MTPVTPALLREHRLPVHAEGDKDLRGRVLIIGGSLEVPGAALLAGCAALRAGAGKLQIATCRSVALPMGLAMPEALVIGLEESAEGGIAPGSAERLAGAAARVDALLIGPGMMDPPATDALTADLLARIERPAVLDAGALACLPELAPSLQRHAGRLVITPHAGEMARLLGIARDDVEADPVAAARRAAALLHCVVVMKGARTHVVSPQGEAWLFSGGSIGLATSGSGDTLAGIICAMLARRVVPVWAAIWGVFLHGEAGARLTRRYGGIGALAREIPGEVPAIMAAYG